MQLYWINQFYTASKFDFERQVTGSFEEAMKKEFNVRVDSITLLTEERLLDTNEFFFKSSVDTSSGRYHYVIGNATNKRDEYSFSSFELNSPLLPQDTIFKRKIAHDFANRMREEDFVNNYRINRLQRLGPYLDSILREFSFDTTRLRPILHSLLAERKILAPFKFYMSYSDSIINPASLPENVQTKFTLLTKSYPTFKYWVKEEKYLRGLFADPAQYIISRMKWMIVASVALVVLAGGCGYLLFKAWMKEKKLSVIKDDFINNVTHELKTPVATIAAAVEALSDFDVLEDKEKSRRYLKHSATELTKLNELINRVLNVSLYENKKLSIVYEPILVYSALKDITDGLQLAAQPKRATIRFESCSDKDILRADRSCFTQSVSNIVQNAIKYSGDPVNITMRCQQADTIFEIVITDNGWGIEPHDLPFIFDKFYRGIRKDHLVKGHGLGLYHVKQIMEMHKGSIEITSKNGTGTTVYLRWPI